MEEVSRQVARLEKEFEFWIRIYPKGIPLIYGTAVKQVQKLELSVESYREMYRAELQKDLGEDFLVGQMKGRKDLNPLRNYFFPMEYCKHVAGVILPFAKEKKLILDSRIKDSEHASEVFYNKGYMIEKLAVVMASSDEPWIIAGDEENIRLRLNNEDVI
jgi:hypothetical protein